MLHAFPTWAAPKRQQASWIFAMGSLLSVGVSYTVSASSVLGDSVVQALLLALVILSGVNAFLLDYYCK